MKTIIIFVVLLLGALLSNVFATRNGSSSNIEIKTVKSSSFLSVNGDVTILKIKKGIMSYKVTNKNHRNFDFYMNANYFTINDIPVGEVKINNKNITRKNSGGGFFTTNGEDPKFYFGDRPKNVAYSSQTHTPVIKNGLINKQLIGKKWTKNRTARLVIGEDRKGNIIIIHTRDNCFLSIREMSIIAQKSHVFNGLMFDGGASIEVGIKNDYIDYHYQNVNDFNRKLFNVPTPRVFIVGNFN